MLLIWRTRCCLKGLFTLIATVQVPALYDFPESGIIQLMYQIWKVFSTYIAFNEVRTLNMDLSFIHNTKLTLLLSVSLLPTLYMITHNILFVRTLMHVHNILCVDFLDHSLLATFLIYVTVTDRHEFT